MDAYAVLGLRPGASKEEIKAKYRELARRWHPDKNKGNAEAELKFKEINQAYEAIQSGNFHSSQHTREERRQRQKENPGDPFGFANGMEWENIKKNFEDALRQQSRTKMCPHCNGKGWIPT